MKCSAFIVTVIVIRKQEAEERKKKFIVTVIMVWCVFQNSCMEIRKLKEMEYEILTSSIRGWEGEVSSEAAVSTANIPFCVGLLACVYCVVCTQQVVSLSGRTVARVCFFVPMLLPQENNILRPSLGRFYSRAHHWIIH